jgi:Tat protein translocase TatB subunit
MFGIGMTELMVIFVIGLVVLGPKRLPELARSLGRSLGEFRRASNEVRREFMSVADEAKIDPISFEPPPETKAKAPAAAVPPVAGNTGEPEPPRDG